LHAHAATCIGLAADRNGKDETTTVMRMRGGLTMTPWMNARPELQNKQEACRTTSPDKSIALPLAD
jgi:hypothetical protein